MPALRARRRPGACAAKAPVAVGQPADPLRRAGRPVNQPRPLFSDWLRPAPVTSKPRSGAPGRSPARGVVCQRFPAPRAAARSSTRSRCSMIHRRPRVSRGSSMWRPERTPQQDVGAGLVSWAGRGVWAESANRATGAGGGPKRQRRCWPHRRGMAGGSNPPLKLADGGGARPGQRCSGRSPAALIRRRRGRCRARWETPSISRQSAGSGEARRGPAWAFMAAGVRAGACGADRDPGGGSPSPCAPQAGGEGSGSSFLDSLLGSLSESAGISAVREQGWKPGVCAYGVQPTPCVLQRSPWAARIQALGGRPAPGRAEASALISWVSLTTARGGVATVSSCPGCGRAVVNPVWSWPTPGCGQRADAAQRRLSVARGKR